MVLSEDHKFLRRASGAIMGDLQPVVPTDRLPDYARRSSCELLLRFSAGWGKAASAGHVDAIFITRFRKYRCPLLCIHEAYG